MTKQITVSELDFDLIKQSLKDFMKGQDSFTDYDFEGSSLSILLDILAYNTHYNSLYTNMAVNEAFLDSASKRNSVVSHAKMLGYTPRSVTSPTASVNLRVYNTSSTPGILTIPKHTPFSTMVDGEQFNFHTTEDVSVSLSGGEYNFSEVSIIEGTPVSFSYTVAVGTKFIIPNQNCDISTLKVRVKENSLSVNSTTFDNVESLVDVTGTSNVYFVKEIEGELYEIEFGDGILGTALQSGNVVTLEYFITNSTVTNKAKFFTYQGGSLLGGTVVVTTVQAASGGRDIEDIESIRFLAPKFFSSQNRAVTAGDYTAIILKDFSEAKSVNVWGGEDNDPPMYGKVFICIKPLSSSKLTEADKKYVKETILKDKMGIAVVAELVDPKDINLEVSSSVYFDPNLTTRTSSDLETLVKETIEDYNTNNLEKFGSGFRSSQLSKLIDQTDNSIVSNITTVKIHYPITPLFNVKANYVISLGNPISDDSSQNILSTGFTILGSDDVVYLEDDGEGILRLFNLTSNNEKVVMYDVGTVDYSTGKIDVPTLNITTFEGTEFKLIIKPESYDIISVRDQIVQIPSELISVSAIVDNADNYIFTSSRS